ncbi:iron-sulfur cluster repair di-iron protein [uncultured Paracoccus sp.]|uniref:iron-sulfur cluster repair di-iron protein n=1 Tax=uncultured Paracoccus sp. TaxID=189685 RepID=UPI00261E2F1C|nr:iron-sulfur cluster repair di-iron protein [uncultured Paracoccus sp.]
MTERAHPLHDQSVGEIAARLAGASNVFRRFGIDFCCQGHVSLKDAANHRSSDLDELETALDALDPSAPQPVPQETGALIEHIKTCYHDVHRQQIPELIALSRKVEAVHVNHPNVPAGLAETLQHVWGELEVHMKKEELMVFPAMLRQRAGSLAEPIREMRHDHNDHAAFLDQIGRLTDDYTPPQDACRSWRTLYDGVAQFRADLMEHVHLENNVLFPRFETAA